MAWRHGPGNMQSLWQFLTLWDKLMQKINSGKMIITKKCATAFKGCLIFQWSWPLESSMLLFSRTHQRLFSRTPARPCHCSATLDLSEMFSSCHLHLFGGRSWDKGGRHCSLCRKILREVILFNGKLTLSPECLEPCGEQAAA